MFINEFTFLNVLCQRETLQWKNRHNPLHKGAPEAGKEQFQRSIGLISNFSLGFTYLFTADRGLFTVCL